MPHPVHRIVLELDDGAVPVTGRVRLGGATAQPFTGWTALISALMAATASSVPAAAPEETPTA